MGAHGPDLINLRLRLGVPPTTDGRDYLSLALNLRLTSLDVLLGGAIAVAIVWIATRDGLSGKGEPLEQPRELPLTRGAH